MGYSMLSEKYGRVYAEYLKKFLDAYEEKGAKIWGISTGTSPVEGFQSWVRDSMGWIPDLQVLFHSQFVSIIKILFSPQV